MKWIPIKYAMTAVAWVTINILLYTAIMAVDKNNGLHIAFVVPRILLVTSLLTKIMVAVGLVKFQK